MKKRIYKVGIIIPSFCDQKYLRDRDREIEASSEDKAIEEFKEYAFKHYLNENERSAVRRGQIKIGIIEE